MVRRHDRDRYLTALFAPPGRREALFALYAFNYEIARVRESVTQPMLGHIRLQWWREAIEAVYAGEQPRRHEVADPLAAAIRDFGLSRAHFDRMIDARELDLADEPPADLAALEAYGEGTSAELIRLALEVLQPERPHPALNPPTLTPPRTRGRGGWGPAAEAAADVGIGYALAGLLRAMPFHARSSRCYIPSDVAAEVELDPRDYSSLRTAPGLRRAVARIADIAKARLLTARQFRAVVPRSALPALLPAVIADRALFRLSRVGWDPFNPHLAAPDPLQSWRLAAAALRGRF
jgi:NADH dehydrogenase [ubiquinone] 1 alpha subcomplex assembly factor 6